VARRCRRSLKTGRHFTEPPLVDAPLIGAPHVALKGAELVIAGGERVDVERVRPVLERLGELRHVGPSERCTPQARCQRQLGADVRRADTIRAVACNAPSRVSRGQARTHDVRASRPPQGPRPRAGRPSAARSASTPRADVAGRQAGRSSSSSIHALNRAEGRFCRACGAARGHETRLAPRRVDRLWRSGSRDDRRPPVWPTPRRRGC
jgi:hypothetical protein